MDLFTRLEAVIREQSNSGELPDMLFEPLLAVATAEEKFAAQRATIELLLTQVENYDAYAGAGCFGDSYSSEDILRTLMQLTQGN